jgi:adenylate kinase family enzyme
MTRPDAILLLGPSGSGKTPLGRLLERDGLWGARCVHFDFGEQLRQAVEAVPPPAFLQPDEVRFLREVLATGALLEDEQFPIAERILRAFLERAGEAPVVLNGLPRHVGQARHVAPLVEVRTVVCLDCPAETVLERIGSNVGRDRTGRADDDLAAVRQKLATYAERTAPLVEHYRQRGVRVVTIPVGAADRPEDTWRRLDAAANR